jgi:hypothetical protein
MDLHALLALVHARLGGANEIRLKSRVNPAPAALDLVHGIEVWVSRLCVVFAC